MTAILALVHAFGTNKDFQPYGLYFATFIIDISIVEIFLQ